MYICAYARNIYAHTYTHICTYTHTYMEMKIKKSEQVLALQGTGKSFKYSNKEGSRGSHFVTYTSNIYSLKYIKYLIIKDKSKRTKEKKKREYTDVPLPFYGLNNTVPIILQERVRGQSTRGYKGKSPLS